MGAICGSSMVKQTQSKNSLQNLEVNQDFNNHSESNNKISALENYNNNIISDSAQNSQRYLSDQTVKLKTESIINQQFFTYQLKSSEKKNNNLRQFYYQQGTLIGQGSYGQVYECLDLNTGEILAVKNVKVSKNFEKLQKEIKSLKEEIAILKRLNHKNIVKYLGTEIHDDFSGVDIILEFVPGGSIKNLLEKFGKLDEKVVQIYTSQILEGLFYLHSQGIVHRDIKGANVLIDTDGTIKLSDFGTSKQIFMSRNNEENPQDHEQKKYSLPKSLKGSPYWMAPEVLLRIGHNAAADIWSVGCCVIEMLTGKPPWTKQANSVKEAIKMIASGKIPVYPPKISSQCKEFLNRCLKYKPEERYTSQQLLQTPFITCQNHDQMNLEESKLTNLNYSSHFSQVTINNTLYSHYPNNKNEMNFKSKLQNDQKEEIIKTQISMAIHQQQQKTQTEQQKKREELQKKWEEELKNELLKKKNNNC